MEGRVPPVIKAWGSLTSSLSEGLERTFDSSWSVPLDVIGRLQSDGYIKQGFSGATFGDMVIVSGGASLLDIGTIKSLWKPGLEMFSGYLPQSTNAERKNAKEFRDNWGKIGQIIDKLPATVQIQISTAGDGRVWGTLNPDHLHVTPDDITMKYGSTVQGIWYLLGIFDARPDSEENVPHTDGNGSFEFQNAILNMMNAIKDMVGRPKDAYGVTPIAVFRKIDSPVSP
ncbi:hypothetical protein JKG47_21095 [Acidithiobacillus sp. MC6.1]|nr:hypothetical protein [Acidithiobacillus sp. MC6.1]